MSIDKYRDYDVEGFLMDDGFLRWVKHPDPESDRFWHSFQERYPKKKNQVKEAVWILRSLQAVEPEVARQRLDQILHSIQRSGATSFGWGHTLLKVAAVLFILILVGGALLYSIYERKTIPFELSSLENFEKGRIILPDGTVREFETGYTNIHQTSEGGITLNNDTIISEIKPVKSGKPALNHVVVPYGKRSQIVMADGTQIWLNSGSQLSYPATLNKGAREVYLDGEAYFDVTTDPTRPFFVVTRDLKIRVTGTRFNVLSYPDDSNSQTVLVSGKVTVARNNSLVRNVELLPGERIVYTRDDESVYKDQVDYNLYTSWINGYLVFTCEPVSELVRKLERYYNKKIITGPGVGEITFSGKLNLEEDLEAVFENISFSTFITYTEQNGVYQLNLSCM